MKGTTEKKRRLVITQEVKDRLFAQSLLDHDNVLETDAADHALALSIHHQFEHPDPSNQGNIHGGKVPVHHID